MVNPWYGPKMAIFLTFFFLGNLGQGFLRYKNKKSKRSNNSHFSKGVNLWFLSKNGHFSNFFFVGNIGQKNVFCDILERKNAFLCYKNKNLKKSKNCHFFKGLTHGFWSINGRFSNFFL